LILHVRYFAAAREAAGTEAEDVELESGATVDGLLARLRERHPDLVSLAGTLRFAIGERFVTAETALSDGDTVVVIPPVSGG
jgi:molybdopterin converting factor subunit 1